MLFPMPLFPSFARATAAGQQGLQSSYRVFCFVVREAAGARAITPSRSGLPWARDMGAFPFAPRKGIAPQPLFSARHVAGMMIGVCVVTLPSFSERPRRFREDWNNRLDKQLIVETTNAHLSCAGFLRLRNALFERFFGVATRNNQRWQRWIDIAEMMSC
jgi:hypothetical protein